MTGSVTKKQCTARIALITTVLASGFGVIAAPPATAQVTLYTFACSSPPGSGGSPCPMGAFPQSLIQATDGDFYGGTQEYGPGVPATIFKLSPSGTLADLYDFPYPSSVAGSAAPLSPALLQAADGNFYGVTSGGGSGAYCSYLGGCGTLFRMTPEGSVTTLYDFCSQPACADGEWPSTPIQAADGNLYGTTEEGGASFGGTVFRITPAGALTILYSFCSQTGCTDGSIPVSLVQSKDGSFYGTTASGGVNNYGTVFEMTPTGSVTTLYSFCSQTGCTDGGLPFTPLVQGKDGNFYGTTSRTGGAWGGTVYRISPSGTLTTLYRFCKESGCAEGVEPGGLVQVAHGNFYGTTAGGGSGLYCPYSGGCGTIFRITADGEFTKVYDFCRVDGCADGVYPVAALIQATDGNLYGATHGGGGNFGTIFWITPIALFPYALVSTSSVGLGDLFVGATSAAQIVTITNSGTAKLEITDIALTGADAGDFAFTSAPPPISLPPGGATTIDVTFAPTTAGRLAADLVITDNSSGIPGSQQTIALSGRGQDFRLVTDRSSATLKAGVTAMVLLSVAPLGGFSQPVNLTCNDPAPNSTCTVNPASVTPNPNFGATVAVSISTTRLSVAAPPSSSPPAFPVGRLQREPMDSLWIPAFAGMTSAGRLAALAMLACLALLAVAAVSDRRLGRVFSASPRHSVGFSDEKPHQSFWKAKLCATGLALLLVLAWASCGGGGQPRTPPGTYTITLKATSGTLSHNTTVTLTLTP